MEIRDFAANRSFSGNGLWQWYEKPGYRVPRSPLGVSNLGGVSNDGKTSQIGSSRLNALVISAKSTGLADVVAASRLRIESSRLFIWSLSRLSSDFTSGPSGSFKSRSDRAASLYLVDHVSTIDDIESEFRLATDILALTSRYPYSRMTCEIFLFFRQGCGARAK